MEFTDISWKKDKIKRNNSNLLPRSIRGIVVGKSGCGKTTLLLNFLLKPGWLDYNNLQVFGKSLFQPGYKILRSSIEKKLPKKVILKLFEHSFEIEKSNINPESIIEEILKLDKNKSDTECKFFETDDDVPHLRDLDIYKNNLMIFNDLLLTNQKKCENYCIRGRHSNIGCFYLAQNYFKFPRQTIRESTNFICMFKQDSKNLSYIYNDHVSDDIEEEKFKRFCNDVWSRPNGFVVIDLSSNIDNGKYRNGLGRFYFPKKAFLKSY